MEPPATPTDAGLDGPFGTVSSEQQAMTPQGPPPSQPQNHGWDSFSSNETWNGMQVTPPGTTSRAGGQETLGRPKAAMAPEASPASGWTTSADDTGHGHSEPTVEGTWFVADETDDDATEPERRGLLGRLLPVDGLTVGPSVVTFIVICLGALLVVSSIIWHPHAP